MASKGHDHGTRHRVLRLFKMIQEQPFRYTRRQLAKQTGVHVDTIKADMKLMGDVGYELEYDKEYRYGFSQDRLVEELKDLLALSTEEQWLLLNALKLVGTQSSSMGRLTERLHAVFGRQAQLEAGYNAAGVHQVGEAAPPYLIDSQQWRRPYLTKFQLLERAKRQCKRVVLVDYRSSNSNEVRDRLVEPFYAKMEDDTLQAFDVDRGKLRHFRLSRIRRIRMTDEPWANEAEHKILATDPFRIVDDEQELVHLRLKVGAYNELVERFPLTRAYIQEDAEEGIYDFQCHVNHRFYGLTNFILGFHHQIVEVVAPEALRLHLEKEAEGMRWKQKS